MREIKLSDVCKNIKELENIDKGDILIIHRNKPFAVVVEHSHFLKMSTKKNSSQDERLELLKNIRSSLNLGSLRE
jgi:hypothetical protein